jgi:hypothetical protein
MSERPGDVVPRVNYLVEATVTNALGSTKASLSAVIATQPSRLDFVTSSEPVREGSGPATIVVERSLDLSRDVSADAVVTIGGTKIRTPLHFGPGETRKSFTVPIPDDNVFSGTRYAPMTFEHPQGGVLTATVDLPPSLVIVDDDPPPTLSIDPLFTIAEGNEGVTHVDIPLHLSAPMGVPLYAYAGITPVAVLPAEIGVDAVTLPVGETSGAVKLTIRGNSLPEPDKTFLVTQHLFGGDADPLLGATTCFVTIVNDDAAIYPAQTTIPADFEMPLTLNIGSPFAVATTVTFTSSAPDVVPVPAPVTIAAGETKVWVMITGRAPGTVQIGAVVPGRTTQPSTIAVTPVRRHAAGR